MYFLPALRDKTATIAWQGNTTQLFRLHQLHWVKFWHKNRKPVGFRVSTELVLCWTRVGFGKKYGALMSVCTLRPVFTPQLWRPKEFTIMMLPQYLYKNWKEHSIIKLIFNFVHCVFFFSFFFYKLSASTVLLLWYETTGPDIVDKERCPQLMLIVYFVYF